MLTMAMYKKKPVVIEACCLPQEGMLESLHQLRKWEEKGTQEPSSFYLSPDGKRIQIITLEGTMEAKGGDWIIRGLEGEFYPCKPSVFGKTYEPSQETHNV